jgi:beta-lactamase regulating signal transducer with metallopeptidase domain
MIDGLIRSGIGPLGFHLWSSTLFLALCLTVVLATERLFSARARSAMLTAAFTKFLLPAVLLLAPLRAAGIDFSRLRTGVPLRGAFRILAPAAVSQPPQSAALSPWLWAGIALWLIVAMLLILRFSISRRRLTLVASKASSAPHPRELDALRRAAETLRLRRRLNLLRAPVPQAPAVLGIFKPLLVIPPSGCEELSDQELEALLRHECAHVLRRDNLVSRIESTLCALFWFNPLLWLAQHLAGIERERACDELAAQTDDQRRIYLSALATFCRNAVAPNLPGISCMASAHLKERMDHLMTYETLQRRTPSSRFIASTASAALVLFTLVSGAMNAMSAVTVHGSDAKPYKTSFTLTRLSGDQFTLECTITDKATHEVISNPLLTMKEGQRASLSSGDQNLQVKIDLTPAPNHGVAADVVILRDGKQIQEDVVVVLNPPEVIPPPQTHAGETIDLHVKDADLGDVFRLFAKLTKKEIEVAPVPAITGKVTVDWDNIPWDEAFARILEQHHLASRVDGNTIHVFPK